MSKKKGKKRSHHQITSKQNEIEPSLQRSTSNSICSKKNDDVVTDTTTNNSTIKVEVEVAVAQVAERYPATEQPTSHRKANIPLFSSWNQAFQAAASITPHDLGNDYIDTTTSLDPNVTTANVPFGSGDVLGVSLIANEYFNSRKDSNVKIHNISKKQDYEEGGKKLKHDDHHLCQNIDDSSSPKKKKKDKKKKDKKKDKKKKKKKKKKSDEKETDEENKKDKKKQNGKDTYSIKKKSSVSTFPDENPNDNHVDDGSQHYIGQQQQLEGKMISHENESIMVLVDKNTKIVYSAMERNDDGSFIQIGIERSDGEIQIQPRNEEQKWKEQNQDEDSESHFTFNSCFPFEVDPDDHCESPLEAYQDIEPILQELVRIQRKKAKGDLAIYDPYYCNGSVIQHLMKLGYTNVYNKKEDCYKTWSSPMLSTAAVSDQTYPNYDLFITNPPYSNDHIEKLITHLTTDERAKGKPWCLLMPTFVHKKDYYKDKVGSKGKFKHEQQHNNKGTMIEPFYLVPKKRYVYVPPKNSREKKLSDVHKKSSPFVSMWYIYGGSQEKTDKLFQAYKKWQKVNSSSKCELARGKSGLRDLRRKKKQDVH